MAVARDVGGAVAAGEAVGAGVPDGWVGEGLKCVGAGVAVDGAGVGDGVALVGWVDPAMGDGVCGIGVPEGTGEAESGVTISVGALGTLGAGEEVGGGELLPGSVGSSPQPMAVRAKARTKGERRPL